MRIWACFQKYRFLNTLLLTWFIPLTIYVTIFSHFKYQYWLPVALLCFPVGFKYYRKR